MERVKWTDERIDERMAAIDEKLNRQLEATRALREELRSGFSGTQASFSELRAGIGALRERTDAGFLEQYHQTLALHRQMIYLVAGFAVALIGLLGGVVAQL
jgi:hypothetical protein